jgi:hypothetical protein
MKAGTADPGKIFIVRQGCGKHVPAVMNNQTTTGELLEVVFSLRYLPIRCKYESFYVLYLVLRHENLWHNMEKRILDPALITTIITTETALFCILSPYILFFFLFLLVLTS